jgi:uncharacterized protein YbjT (DUF2867 family)
VEASRTFGVDAVTGRGLDRALEGAEVVVDCSNAPELEGEAAVRFFKAAGRNLMAAGRAAGVKHHIALSIVGTDRLKANGYFRAKKLQEDLITASGLPYSILRATQFFEFLDAIADASAHGDEVRIAPARIQRSADVAIVLSNLVRAEPLGATVELAGPDSYPLDSIVSAFMAATGDHRRVVTDPAALYFGTVLSDETLMAGGVLRFGYTEFDAWLRRWVREHPPAERSTPSSAAFATSLPLT